MYVVHYIQSMLIILTTFVRVVVQKNTTTVTHLSFIFFKIVFFYFALSLMKRTFF